LADFWNSLLTEKSWSLLQNISKEQFKFILIGGWASYLWTKLHKSKDIDIVLIDLKDLDYLKQKYDLKKNDNLKKYEIVFGDIDLDIYVPYFSKLAIPIEGLDKYTTKIEGFNVVKPEVLLILKQGAELQRGHSIKGEKDRIDIVGILLFTDVDFKSYFDLLKKYKLDNYFERLKEIIKTFKECSYLNLNPREFKLKKEKISIRLKKL